MEPVGHSLRITLEDLGSLNGTFHNDARLSQPVDVQPGDTIRLGNIKFAVELENPAT